MRKGKEEDLLAAIAEKMDDDPDPEFPVEKFPRTVDNVPVSGK